MRKILVADDHAEILRYLQLTLTAEGYEVITAGDGAQALRRAREEKPDLIVLDVMMPEVDGFRVLTRLRADPVFASTVVVMLTGGGNPEDVALGLDIGADYFLMKPFGLTEIQGLIRRVLPARESCKLACLPVGKLEVAAA